MNLDRRLSDAKHHTTRTLCRAVSDKNFDISELASSIDDLNKAWDELTDALVRQREERDRVIRQLIDELAEARAKR